MSTVEDLIAELKPSQFGIEQDGETVLSYDELMSSYQDYETLAENGDIASDTTGLDMIAAQKQYQVMGNVEDLFTDDKNLQFYIMLREEINRCLKHLSEQQRYVMNFRYGLNGNPVKSRKKIAKELGISESGVLYTEFTARVRLSNFKELKKLSRY